MYEYKATIIRVVDGDTVDVDIDLGFDVGLRSQRIRLFRQLIHQNVELEINRLRKPTDYSQKPTPKRLSSWEEFMRSEQGRRESLEGTWVKSKLDGRPLINYSSKKSWLSRTPGKIKKT